MGEELKSNNCWLKQAFFGGDESGIWWRVPCQVQHCFIMQKEKEKTSDQITKEEYKRKGKQVAADEPIQVAGLSLPPKKIVVTEWTEGCI